MTYEDVRAFALRLPGVVDGVSYGHACLKAHGKFLTRLLEDGDSLVCPGVSLDEREMLIAAEPETFHVTDHYRNYPYVLVRLSRVHPGTVQRLLERRWRAVTPKAAVKAWDAAQGSTS
ncbi:MmcQ/YjbR family DNA-binding protein [Caulobacter sp. LARHSG274]